MKMFSSFKKTLLNVTKTVNFINIEDQNRNQKVVLNVGSALLDHSQKQWQMFHAANESNARKASEVYSTIKTLENKLKADKQNIESVNNMLTFIKTTTETCVKQVNDICAYCDIVEKDLIDIEDVIEEIELVNGKQLMLDKLEQYKQKKREKLHNIEVNLEEHYQKALAEHEMKEKQILEERQKVFQEAFKEDLEHFRSAGRVPKLDVSKGTTGPLLEEINLECDQDALNQFLEEGGPSE